MGFGCWCVGDVVVVVIDGGGGGDLMGLLISDLVFLFKIGRASCRERVLRPV